MSTRAEIPEAAVERGAHALFEPPVEFTMEAPWVDDPNADQWALWAKHVLTAALDLDGSRTGEDAVTRMARRLRERDVDGIARQAVQEGGPVGEPWPWEDYMDMAQAALEALLGEAP